MKNEIRLVFFDIGGVLLSDGWGRESRALAAKTFGIDEAEMEERHRYNFYLYETGKYTLDEYLNAVVFYRQRTFSAERFRAFFLTQTTALPMLHWLKDWKRNHPAMKVISLNNEGRELNEVRIQQFGLNQCFDGFVSSCNVGLQKPDPAMYLMALDMNHQEAGSCLYFDDHLPLVEAGWRCGINAYHHTSIENTAAILHSYIDSK